MRFIFNTPNSTELSATRRQTVLADDGKVRYDSSSPRWTVRATALRKLPELSLVSSQSMEMATL